MKFNFFAGCNDLNEIKKRYKELAKIHHPDKGGDTATMQAINTEYEAAIRWITAGNGTTGKRYTQEEADGAIFEAEAYREAINKVINLEGIVIEVIGGWVWITGETRQYKELLKSEPARYFWASVKQAWYFRPPEWKSRNKEKLSLDQIRSRYGSQVINGHNRNKFIKG